MAAFELSVCVEMIFVDGRPLLEDRVRAAADAGIHVVEIWGTADRDVGALAQVLDETGVKLHSLVAEPRERLVDVETHGRFLEGVRASVARAVQLGCPNVVVSSREGVPFTSRPGQHATVVEVLAGAAKLAEDAGVTLMLENLNSRHDHPGILFDTTAECLQAICEVDSTALRLLYDMYHSVAMGEDPAQELAGSMDLVAHVQIADWPGRGEPGSGTIDWRHQLRVLRDLGYHGPLGLEYIPTTSSLESLRYVNDLLVSV